MESSAVLPLRLLHTDPTRRCPGAPDAAVSGSCHCDGDPTRDISACSGVGLLPLCGEADGQALQRGLCFCAQHAVYRDDDQLKVAPLLKTGVKVPILLSPFHHR